MTVTRAAAPSGNEITQVGSSGWMRETRVAHVLLRSSGGLWSFRSKCAAYGHRSFAS